jgi:rSAM/selenodomain-associated transferase 2
MISVIIPTLNEAELLPDTLSHIQANHAPHEILVADAGSTDGTADLADKAGARVIHSPRRNRAAQMNLAAQTAHGEIFLFLHADTWLGPKALSQIVEALEHPGIVGGGFARRFRSSSLLLRLTCVAGEWRSKWFGWFYGDQGIFVRKKIFEQVGGFRDWPLFEDLDLSRRIARVGRVTMLRSDVVSSARRFASRGALFTTASDVFLTLRYLAGADPRHLAPERREVEIPAGSNEQSGRR